MSFTISASKRTDLYLTVVARAVSLLGDEAAVIALSLRLHDNGGGASAIAALLVAGFLPLVVLAPVAGAIVDRFDSRRLLVSTSVAQAALCLVLSQVQATPAVLSLVVALGAGQAINGATWQALLPSIAGVDGLPRAIGLSQAATTLAAIAAPAAGGLLTGLWGPRVPLLLDAATFVVIAVAALLVRTRRTGNPRKAGERGGLSLVRRDPVLLRLLAMLGVFITLGGMVNVVEIFLVRDTLHATAVWYGALGAVWGTGMFAGSVLGGRLQGEEALLKGLLASACVLSIAVAGYAGVGSVALIVPLALLGGAANGVLNLTNSSLVMMRAPEQARGRIAAALNGTVSASLIGAYMIGGLLAAHLTPRTIFLFAGLLGLIAPMYFGAALLRAVRGGPAKTAPQEAIIAGSEA
jgi:MFS family permease